MGWKSNDEVKNALEQRFMTSTPAWIGYEALYLNVSSSLAVLDEVLPSNIGMGNHRWIGLDFTAVKWFLLHRFFMVFVTSTILIIFQGSRCLEINLLLDYPHTVHAGLCKKRWLRSLKVLTFTCIFKAMLYMHCKGNVVPTFMVQSQIKIAFSGNIGSSRNPIPIAYSVTVWSKRIEICVFTTNSSML